VGQYFFENGTCGTCGVMTNVRQDLKGCISVDCLYETEIELRETGSTAVGDEETWCEECPDYTKPNEDASECVRPDCPPRAIFEKDGTCRTCPEYYTPELPDRTRCYRRICLASENKIVDKDG
jgi:hypothetical protein